MVPTDQQRRPALLALQEEHDVAGGRGRLVAPVGDQRVEDEVALGALRRRRRRTRCAGRRGPRGCRGRGCRRRRRRRTWRRRRRCGRRRGPGCRRRSCCATPSATSAKVRSAATSGVQVHDRHLQRVHVDPAQGRPDLARGAGRRGSGRWCGGSSRCGPRPAPTGACTRSPSCAGPAAGEAGSRSPAPGSAASGGRRAPTPRAATGGVGSSPSGNRVIDQISISVSSGPERPEPVGGRAAVHRQDEVVREHVAHRLVHPRRLELVEVGDRRAGVAVRGGDRVVVACGARSTWRAPGRRAARSSREAPRRCGRRGRGPCRPCPRSSCGGSAARRRPSARGSKSVPGAAMRPGMRSCGWVSSTWYCSTNASCASFQFTGRRQAYHHSARSDSTFQASRIVAAGSMLSRSGEGVVVEVDPGAAAPGLAADGPQVEVAGLEVVLGERLACG